MADRDKGTAVTVSPDHLNRLDLSDQLSWSQLLSDVADGRMEVTLKTPDGGRVALIAEDRLNDLRRRLALGNGAGNGNDQAPTLSGREVQILELAAGGASGVAIASELGIAVNTVAQHLVSVRRKFGVRTTVEAVGAARRSGMIAPTV